MGKDFKVSFTLDGKAKENVLYVRQGITILEAATKLGTEIRSSCGGKGNCGKCKVIVQRGRTRPISSKHLSIEEIQQGYCLACQTEIFDDLIVRIPWESQAEKQRIVEESLVSEALRRLPAGEPDPLAQKIHLSVDPPSLSDNSSDFERLKRAIKRKIGIENLRCNVDILRELAAVLRKGSWQVTVTLMDTNQIVNIEEGDTTLRHYGLAVDIGTITVVVRLVDLNDGKIIDSCSDYNAQLKHGEDVISRITYTYNGDGLAELQKLILGTINKLSTKILRKNDILRDEISSMVVAGNTTMIHLFLGVDPQYIREEPYTPAVTFFPLLEATELGIDINPNACIYCLPAVGSYVGGDIVAGVLSTDVTHSEKLSLFIDVGANGEIVLGNSEWLVACSCSAGPAFEGSGVKCGMRATTGAIEEITIDENFDPHYKTIGAIKPRGICGSGLIDLMAELLTAGIIDRAGKIDLSLSSERIRKGIWGPEYVIEWGENTQSGRDIVITEVDIANLIRTKGAIYAGCAVLVEHMNFTFNDIDQVIIAGGFGKYIDVEKGVTIGLLPDIDRKKFTFVGNSSVMGAQLVLLSRKLREEAEKIAHNMTYLELSVDSKFMDKYTAALFLPHTNIELFPEVKMKLVI